MFDNNFSELIIATIEQKKWMRYANKQDLLPAVKKYSPDINGKISKDDLVKKSRRIAIT